MKKALILTAALMLALAGCGPAETRDEISERDREEIVEATEAPTAAEETKAEDKEDDDDEIRVRGCSFEINCTEKPEVSKIDVIAKCSKDAIRGTDVTDLYGKHVIHSGVVGLIGAPVEVEYSPEVGKPRLCFHYEPDKLRGVPEKNLIGLCYGANEDYYEIMDVKLDTDAHTVTMKADEPGVYMLVDAYQWLGCWGYDVSEYEYDSNPASYDSDWERSCDTGSIMELADKEWAFGSGQSFSVTTPQELASVVYYVNANTDNKSITVSIDADIDLAGYDWRPMGWTKAGVSCPFSGRINGNGHTIYNMTMHCGGENDIGFIGYGLQTEVNDINFVNAKVEGGARTGIVGGEIYSSRSWSGISVSGEITSRFSEDCGAVIGREAGTSFKDCTADCTLNGVPISYLSYRQKVVDETEVSEDFTLVLNTDGSITRNEFNGSSNDLKGYWNLGWYILRDGELMLHRSADNETTLPAEYAGWGDTVYLVAYINGAYIRVSNIIQR